MDHSDSITKIGAAIRDAQTAIDHVEKTSTNPHFGNTYTDLNAFLKAVRGPLAAEGVTMIQAPGVEDGWVTVETLLLHDSGEWIRARAAAPMQKNDPQGVGSAITYLRRYSLASLLAIPQEDDDGNAASKRRSVSRGETSDSADFHCPDCGGPMWDNRDDEKASRNGGKRPDFKCKDKSCDHAIWGEHPDEIAEDAEELAEEVSDLLDTAASLSLVSVERSANIESAVKNRNADVLRIAHDWLQRQIDKAQAEEDREPVVAGVDGEQSDIPF